MIKNRQLIQKTILFRTMIKQDPVQQFSTRQKSSSVWSEFEPYTEEAFERIYQTPLIDGVKLKFQFTTLIINGRHFNNHLN